MPKGKSKYLTHGIFLALMGCVFLANPSFAASPFEAGSRWVASYSAKDCAELTVADDGSASYRRGICDRGEIKETKYQAKMVTIQEDRVLIDDKEFIVDVAPGNQVFGNLKHSDGRSEQTGFTKRN